MGTFRTLLAISVVFAHLSFGERMLVGGKNAVQIFYMVSGFLITFVLNNSYSDTKAFYLNRALRIFPIYWLVAIAIGTFHLFAQTGFYSAFSKLPISADIFLIFSNIFLFGQDWVMFFGVQGNELVPVSNFVNSDIPLFYALLISPAWSLGVELSFYLIAPFVVRKLSRVILIFSASILLRILLISKGFTADPWSYRFFPTELAFFMAGSLACHYGIAIWQKINCKLALFVALTVIISYPEWSLDDPLKSVLLLIAVLMVMPGLFVFQSRFPYDKKIGELSYPIYICHLPVLQMLPLVVSRPHPGFTLAVVIITAILLSIFVGRKLEIFRSQVRKEKILNFLKKSPRVG